VLPHLGQANVLPFESFTSLVVAKKAMVSSFVLPGGQRGGGVISLCELLIKSSCYRFRDSPKKRIFRIKIHSNYVSQKLGILALQADV